MNEDQLRALVREEIEVVLEEELRIDSHQKFRHLVEAKRGIPFTGSDDSWTETYVAWNAALSECNGVDMDKDVLDYYVDDVVQKLDG